MACGPGEVADPCATGRFRLAFHADLVSGGIHESTRSCQRRQPAQDCTTMRLLLRSSSPRLAVHQPGSTNWAGRVPGLMETMVHFSTPLAPQAVSGPRLPRSLSDAAFTKVHIRGNEASPRWVGRRGRCSSQPLRPVHLCTGRARQTERAVRPVSSQRMCTFPHALRHGPSQARVSRSPCRTQSSPKCTFVATAADRLLPTDAGCAGMNVDASRHASDVADTSGSVLTASARAGTP
jgi:hypothetical protein